MSVGDTTEGHCPAHQGPAHFDVTSDWLRDGLICRECGSLPRSRALSLVTFDWGLDLETVIAEASGLRTTTLRLESREYGIMGEFREVFVSRKRESDRSATPRAQIRTYVAKARRTLRRWDSPPPTKDPNIRI